jgi:hypothetical protein
MSLLFNRIGQCCAAHIVHTCQLTILNNIVEPESGVTILLTTVNNVGRTTLFNPVFINIATVTVVRFFDANNTGINSKGLYLINQHVNVIQCPVKANCCFKS